MARFRVSDPETGLTATLEGDSSPTEQELDEVFTVLNARENPVSLRSEIPAPGESASILSGRTQSIPQAFPIDKAEQVQTEAIRTMAQRAMADTGEVLRIGERPVELPRFGAEGSMQRGVSDVIAGLGEFAINKPEELVASLYPPTAAAIAIRYGPEIGKQWLDDIYRGFKGDKEAAGRAVGMLAAVGGPLAAKQGVKAIREAKLDVEYQAQYSGLVDKIARERLSPYNAQLEVVDSAIKPFAPASAEAVKQTIQEVNKPAPVAPEQAQPAVAPTKAAASEAKTSGVTAPEAPSAISEATTVIEGNQQFPTGPVPKLRGFEYHPSGFVNDIPVFSHPDAKVELARLFGIPNLDSPIGQKPMLLFIDETQGGRPVAYFTSEKPTTPVEVKQTAPAEPNPFRPEALETPASKTMGAVAPGLNLSAQTKRTIGDFMAQFRVRGHFPQEVHQANVMAEGLRNKWDRNIAYSQRDLMRALGEVYNIGPIARLGGGSRRIPSDAVRLMDDYMKGQVANPNVIPPKVRGVLDVMRNQIDSLSDEMVQMLTAQRNRLPAGSAKWESMDNLIEKIKANREIYAHRSYKFFDDKIKAPDWWDDLPSDIKTNAEDLLMSRNPAMTRDEAISHLQAWLSDLKETGGYGQAKQGAKDITILLKRKVIDPELRAVLGEHRDPIVNYAKSVSKMANWISNQRFREEVRRQGMGRFLFEDGAQPPGFSVKLAAEGSDSMSPLNGLRTTQEIADAFNSAKEAQVKNPVWKTYLMVNAWTKIAATAQSVMGHARNLLSRGPMALMAGHYDVTKLPSVASKIYQDLAGSDAAARPYLNRAAELRVIHDSARGAELRAVIKDANLNDYPGDLTSWSLMRAIRKVGVDIPSDLWRLSDDLGNLLGWEIEKANQRKVHPGWTNAQIETEAAKIVRSIYPFYSETPKVIQGFRKLPIGPFVTFPYQVFRTTWNSISRTIHEIRSANPAERQLGYKRMAGQIAALAGGYALQEFSKMVLGISDQQEEDFRRGQPSWSKNNKFVFTGKEPGKLDSINLSYTDPYAYLSDPATAILSGLRDDRDPVDVMLQTAAEGLRPFVSEQMLANALKEVAVGKTDEGRDIWNATDSWLEKSQKIGQHIGQTLLPGTVQRIERRIIPAAKNEQPLYGRKLELGPEIFREASGVAVEKYDFKTGLAYNSRDFTKLESAAEDHFRKVLTQTQTTTPQDMIEAYKESDRRRFEIWKEFRKDYLAAVRNGVSPDDAMNLMVARGVDRRTALAISEGTYVPMQVSKQAAMMALERNREIPLAEIQDYSQSVADKPLSE